ncbi:MAG TPA: CcmD family protein [Polyangiaceae bacterium]|nr:CcmD family protein [Polyangiaceae bacterium]
MTQAAPNSGTLDDPNARSTEFVAVQGGGDTTSAATLLVTAYIVMWALLLGFVFLSWRRQGRVEARLSELEKSLASGEPKHNAHE